jgi:hypothetical protein
MDRQSAFHKLFLQESAGVRIPLAPQQNRSSDPQSEVSHVTSVVVASIHAQKNRAGTTYRVLWRETGRQRSLTFANLPSAERFNVDRGSRSRRGVADHRSRRSRMTRPHRHRMAMHPHRRSHRNSVRHDSAVPHVRHARHRPRVRLHAYLRGHRDHDRALGQTTRRQCLRVGDGPLSKGAGRCAPRVVFGSMLARNQRIRGAVVRRAEILGHGLRVSFAWHRHGPAFA